MSSGSASQPSISADMVFVSEPAVTNDKPEARDASAKNETNAPKEGSSSVDISRMAPVRKDALAATPAVKLQPLDNTWTKRGDAMKQLLIARALKPEAVLEPFGTGVHTNLGNIPTAFPKVELFGFEKNTVVETTTPLGYTLTPTIPVHIYGLDMMVVGKTTKADFHKKLEREWKAVVDHVVVLTGNNLAFANAVLGAILKKHVAESASMYSVLVHCSDSTGLCMARATLLVDWVENLKDEADDYWNVHKKDLIISGLRGALISLKKKKTKSAEITQEAIADEYTEM